MVSRLGDKAVAGCVGGCPPGPRGLGLAGTCPVVRLERNAEKELQLVGVAAGEVCAATPAGVAELGGEFHAAVFIADAGGDHGADADLRGSAD